MKTEVKDRVPILSIIAIYIFFINIIAIGAEDTSFAKSILDKMNENRGKIENFKCINEKLIYHSPEMRQNVIRSAEIRGISGSEANEWLEIVYRYQKDYLALDSKYSGRVETITEEVDSKGNLTGNRLGKRIFTWDTNNAIKYTEKSKAISAIIGVTDQPIETSERYLQPWSVFGGYFSRDLAKALKNNEDVNIKKQDDGKYRIEFILSQNTRLAGVVDPSQGYSVVLQEQYKNGKLKEIRKAQFEEVQSGIWFPINGQYTVLNPDTQDVFAKFTMKIKEIKINDPNFYVNLYHVDFPEGTTIADIVTGLIYKIGDSTEARVSGTGLSLKNVVDKTLIDINNNIQIKQDKDIWIPLVSIAIDKDASFVINIADSIMVNPKNKPESEAANKYLSELGKGDIAWDGSIITTRGAKVFTTKNESMQPLKLTENKWTNSYKLPEKVELPYSLLVVTKENDTYLVNISEIESDGIWLNYRKLDLEEISIYKEETKK